jgi:acyl-[acyl-carrier-protein]-phospholipid O-acyltransferase / long-chain-fatty-acid--[acyl-carrier-protein] ligase
MKAQGQSQFALLKTRRFLPLFVTVALSAFVDNAFRFAVAALIVSTLGAGPAELPNTISAALFTLPFFLFSATAGKMAEKYDKAMLARYIKLAEVGIIILSIFALFGDSVPFKQFCIFLAGAQSAIFGPIKYGILPQHLKQEELIGGNGMVEMATFLAILLGTIFGNTIIDLGDSGHLVVGGIMLLSAIGMYGAACMIPPAPPPMPDIVIRKNFLADTWESMKLARERNVVFQAIMGISWFWLLGVVFVTQMQAFTGSYLNGTPGVASQVFALFSIGIAVGSVFCNWLLNGKITAKFVPIAALLMSVFMIDLFFAAASVDRAVSAAIEAGTVPVEVSKAGEKLVGGLTIIGFAQTWRVYFDFFAIAFCSGLFVVPLFAIMQSRTPFYQRARIVGSNNIYNALFMVGVTVLSGLLLQSGVSIRTLFLLLGLANLLAAIYIIRILPHDLLTACARFIFRLFYQVEVKGIENLDAAGRKALIVANHTSLLDGPLLSAFLPQKASFAINTHMAKAWWVKPAFALFELCTMDPGNPMSLRTLVDRLKSGKRVVIFPEGRITVTGGLMKIYEGPGAIAAMAKAKVVPVRIDGAQFSPFSRLKGVYPRKLFPKITLTFLPPVSSESPEHLKGAALREHQAEKLYTVMTDMVFKSSNIDQTVWQSLLDARAAFGGKRIILEDIQRTPMSINRLILGSFILGRKLDALTPGQKNVGILMPNANATVAAIFGLYAFGKVPAMLNFSTGAVNMSAACTAAQIRTIITSRKFIEAGEMEDDVKLLEKSCKIVYLEDVRETVGALDKLRGIIKRLAPSLGFKMSGASTDAHSPAVILFTSGSEGVPKGVVLSHRNVIANKHQILARIALMPNDIFFCALPIFHAFGYLGGVMLPATTGMRAFLYPSPLHYKIVPELVYDTNATILFSTDTFLQGYARNAHPYDFYSVRLLVGGAERVKPETRALYMERFGLRIIEGYGATECSPTIAANTFMHSKTGSVGRIFDGMDWKLEPVEGIAEGGRLWVKGPNIMLGYLRADNPGVIEAPKDGWYDTGDIVTVDELGYVTIQGRAKRFSKIAGEMVSLTALEAKLGELYPDFTHAVVSAPDAKKGEQLVMFTTLPKPDRKEIAAGLKKLGCSELMIPKNVFAVEALPVLGSGKTDYVSLNRMGLEKVAE